MRRLTKSQYYADAYVDVRFQEVDTLHIVWHGHYISYFEVARETFGKEYGMSYQSFIDRHIAVPVTLAHCEYKRSLKYGDRARVRAYFIESRSAKIIYTYEVFNADTDQLVATGRTEQVFTDPASGDLFLQFPDFYSTWVDELKARFT